VLLCLDRAQLLEDSGYLGRDPLLGSRQLAGTVGDFVPERFPHESRNALELALFSSRDYRFREVGWQA
jgi:hypothetical protein